MADEPIPSRSQPLSTNVTPALPDGVGAPGRHAIKTAVDGIRGKPTRDADKEAPPLHIPWTSRLLNLGAQLAFGLLVAVFLLVVLLVFFEFSPTSAGGWSVIVALLVTIFVRHYIHWPLPKEALAREPRLPPNVRPSESSGREIVETIVFVVVLVLLLKSFAAEAFVIPTGSMAETLLGYNKDVKCPSCGITFPVNCSNEVDPQEDSKPRITNGCTCPNCRRLIRLVDPKRDGRQPRSGVFQQDGDYMEVLDPGWSSGDRVLVGKFFDATARMKRLLGRSDRNPERLDVVVFKYPEGPQKNHIAMNYIKRLIGLPGETIAIWGGNLYVLSADKSPTYDDSMLPEDKQVEKRGKQEIKHTDKDRWKPQYMHANDKRAGDLFEAGAFEIVRKPPDVLLSIKRLVYDNDHQASDLTGELAGEKGQRWQPDADAWEREDQGKAFRHGTRAGDDGAHWLHYRHLLRRHHGRPTLITDFMGYNSTENLQWDKDLGKWMGGGGDSNGNNWVGDLILECEVKIDKAEGELVLELVRGADRFRAKWNLASEDGLCTLTRSSTLKGNAPEETLEQKPTRLRKGTYRLRFANVDRRLTVWVDNGLPFGDGVNYEPPPPRELGPSVADLQPASIGVKGGALTVRKLKLWRDTYHAVYPNKVNLGPNSGGDVTISQLDLEGPTKDPMTGKEVFPDSWKALKNPPLLTLYVQPGHYLCLGDNSPQSSDSRSWGLVPERLLLGRALLVYWPPSRGGRIR